MTTTTTDHYAQRIVDLVHEEAARLAAPKPLDPTQGEPPLGSILLVHGLEGTAYQRHYSDGLYHSTTGRTLTFEQLLATDKGGDNGRLLLVHRGTDGEG